MENNMIAVIAFDRISPFHLSVPCAVFGEDRREAGVPQFELLVCGFEKGALTTSAGFSLTGIQGLLKTATAGMVIVPSWRDPREEPPHRQGGQAQFIEPLRETPATDRFSQVMEWVQKNPEASHSLDSLATRAYMSRRTFTRRFRQATGTTVGAWLLDQRLALAQRLLETTGMPINLIAQQAGFGSEVSLRKQFSKRLKTSPARYRKEFRTG